MSEPINPGQGASPTSLATDATETPVAAEAAGGGSRTLLIALLAVLGALVLGGGLFLLFSNLGSGGSTSGGGTTTLPPPPPGPTSASPTLTSASPIPTQTLAGRDPFAPIYAPLPTTVAPTGTTIQPTTIQPTTIQPTTVRPTTVQPTTVRPTTVQPTTVRPTTVSPTSTSGGTYKLKLFSVSNNVADIRVNGVDFAPRLGETFDSTFQYLRNYKDDCIGVLYGDQEFPICEGETVVIN